MCEYALSEKEIEYLLVLDYEVTARPSCPVYPYEISWRKQVVEETDP